MSTMTDQCMRKVSATTAIISLAEIRWLHCVHTPTESLIAVKGALHVTNSGRIIDPE